jgi:hypothetical protein
LYVFVGSCHQPLLKNLPVLHDEIYITVGVDEVRVHGSLHRALVEAAWESRCMIWGVSENGVYLQMTMFNLSLNWDKLGNMILKYIEIL